MSDYTPHKLVDMRLKKFNLTLL